MLYGNISQANKGLITCIYVLQNLVNLVSTAGSTVPWTCLLTVPTMGTVPQTHTLPQILTVPHTVISFHSQTFTAPLMLSIFHWSHNDVHCFNHIHCSIGTQPITAVHYPSIVHCPTGVYCPSNNHCSTTAKHLPNVHYHLNTAVSLIFCTDENIIILIA